MLSPFVDSCEAIFASANASIVLTQVANNVQMILKTAGALVALLLEVFGVYGDGEFTWYNG